jgi:hypothetical protein
MTRMNWSRPVHRTHGKRTLSLRDEQEFEDRASRWLAAAERRQPERRNIVPSRRPGNWTTANSTEVPW